MKFKSPFSKKNYNFLSPYFASLFTIDCGYFFVEVYFTVNVFTCMNDRNNKKKL